VEIGRMGRIGRMQTGGPQILFAEWRLDFAAGDK